MCALSPVDVIKFKMLSHEREPLFGVLGHVFSLRTAQINKRFNYLLCLDLENREEYTQRIFRLGFFFSQTKVPIF